jgi:hypothetical protein
VGNALHRRDHDTVGRFRRILLLAGRPSEGPLTEPTADPRAYRWELVKNAPFRPSGLGHNRTGRDNFSPVQPADPNTTDPPRVLALC